jgi:hypothetical protein
LHNAHPVGIDANVPDQIMIIPVAIEAFPLLITYAIS